MRLSPALAALATTLVLGPVLLSPGIFGNMPLAMVDEEVFVRTALAALAQHTVPGFADAGAGFQAPYGAVLTYALFILLAPLYLLATFATGSEHAAGLLLGARVGDLIQLARWIDGAALLAFFASLAYAATAHTLLRRSFALIALLLLGNTLLLSLAHTGKMWALQTVFELAAGALVLAREALGGGTRFRLLDTGYVPVLILLSILAALQSFMGILAGLWIVYAVLLGHTTPRHVFHALVRLAPVALLCTILDYSFLKSGWRISADASAGLTHVTGARVLPLTDRVLPPLISTLAIAPVSVIAWVASIAARLSVRPLDARLVIALAHPLIIYGAYFIIAGFGTSLRYLGPLSGALALSAGLLALSLPRLSRFLIALALPAALAASTVLGWLWWQPSSEIAIRDLLLAPGIYSQRGTTLYLEAPQLFPLARLSDANNRTTLSRALQHAGSDRGDYERAWDDIALTRAFVSDGRFSRARIVSVLDRTLPSTLDPRSFSVTDDCARRCEPREIQDGSCVALNATASDGSDQHGNLLSFPDLLRVSALGHAYFVRELR